MENYWTRRRTDRRTLLKGAAGAGAGLGALALAGCGDDDDTPAATGTAPAAATASGSATAAGSATTAPKKGGEATFGVGAPSTQTLDPHISATLAFSYWGLLTNKLVSPHLKTLEPIQGVLVESWEQVDKTTMTLKARQGAKWHGNGKVTNGRAFTAKDIVYNLNRIAGKLPIDEKRKAQFQRSTTLFGMEKAEAVDETTVKLTFNTPNSVFMQGLADWRNWAVAEELVEKDPDFKDPKNFTGTGAFMMDKWDGTTNTGHYVANPEYWKAGKPYLQGIQQVSLGDPAALVAAFVSGKTDILALATPQLRAQVAQAKPDAKILKYEGLTWDYIRLHQSHDVFKDPRVRRALFLAINYSELMDANYEAGYWDFTGPLVSGLPGAWSAEEVSKKPGWSTATKQKDIADAKALLSAAGFPDGKIKFGLMPTGAAGTYYDHSVRLQDQLKKVWPAMDVSLAVPVDNATWARNLATGTFDVLMFADTPAPSALLLAASYFRSGGGQNYTQVSDPAMDALLGSAYAEFDGAARNKVYDQLQQKLTDEALLLPMGRWRNTPGRQARLVGLEEYAGQGGFSQYYDYIFGADQLSLA